MMAHTLDIYTEPYDPAFQGGARHQAMVWFLGRVAPTPQAMVWFPGRPPPPSHGTVSNMKTMRLCKIEHAIMLMMI